jgi:hypothetical protein
VIYLFVGREVKERSKGSLSYHEEEEKHCGIFGTTHRVLYEGSSVIYSELWALEKETSYLGESGRNSNIY